MNNLLIKIKLIDDFTTILKISKKEFIDKLSLITEEEKTGIFSKSFSIFSSNKKEYKGQVYLDGFKIKKQRKFFDTKYNLATAEGALTEKDGLLTIKTEINGFNNFMLFFGILLIFFYSIFLSIVIIDLDLFIIPFILIHGAIIFSIPYFILKGSVRKLKYELEREFFYLTKDY